jgi:hypothetical protein
LIPILELMARERLPALHYLCHTLGPIFNFIGNLKYVT